jgi:hypothetical protein
LKEYQQQLLDMLAKADAQKAKSDAQKVAKDHREGSG